MSPWAWTTLTVVTFLTWMQPLIGHHTGWLTVYGGQQTVEANFLVKGYEPSWSPTRCGLATISPAMLGQIIWVRPGPGGEWVMCYGVDSVSRVDWQTYTGKGYLADLPRALIQSWGSEYGVEGEIYMGICPPRAGSRPTPFEPVYEVDHHRPVTAYSAWPYPEQQEPMDCTK